MCYIDSRRHLHRRTYLCISKRLVKFLFFFCSCAVLLSFCDHWLLSLRLFSFHSLGRWRHQRDQHHPCGQGGLRESWCLSVWTAQSPGTGILWQGNLLLLFRFLSILTTCLFFSSSFATLTPQPTKIVASLTVFLVFVIFLGGIFLKKNYFAGVPGTKGDSSRCQPALCHEGPQEGHTKRYSNVRLGYGREILRIATFLCFGFWLHWQGKKNKEKWVSWVFFFFVELHLLPFRWCWFEKALCLAISFFKWLFSFI